MSLDAKTQRLIVRILREVVPPHLWKGEPSPALSLTADLGMDSLAKAAFAFRVEDELGVDVATLAAAMNGARTVADAFAALEKLLDPGAATSAKR